MKQVQEAGTATQKPNNGSDPEQGLSPNAKKEKARTSGVGVDANKSIDMSFKAFKANSKAAKHNGGVNPPGDKAVVKSTTAPAANQKTEAVQVDELSKGTMGSYIKKAKSDMGSAEQDVGSAKSKAWMLDKKTNKIGDDAAKRSRKRKAGIDTAVNKLVKTEATAACTCENCTCNPCQCGIDDVIGETYGGVKKGKPIKGTIGDPVKLYKEKKKKGMHKMPDGSMMKDDDPSMKEQKKKAKKDDKLDDGDGMDPVGQADADIDNDGDTDKTDDYLNNRRDAIRSKMKNKKGKGKVGEKAVMHGGKSSKEKEEVSVGEDK